MSYLHFLTVLVHMSEEINSYELFKRFFDGSCAHVSEGINSSRELFKRFFDGSCSHARRDK